MTSFIKNFIYLWRVSLATLITLCFAGLIIFAIGGMVGYLLILTYNILGIIPCVLLVGFIIVNSAALYMTYLEYYQENYPDVISFFNVLEKIYVTIRGKEYSEY